MRIEVAYAKPAGQALLALDLPEGATALDAIEKSGILARFPEIDLAGPNKTGIFGKPCALGQVLKDGDRVEIYRPLLHDPKDARRGRAARR